MNIVYLDTNQLDSLRIELEGAWTARIAIDGGGIKVSADQGIWTLPIGTTQHPFAQSAELLDGADLSDL